MNSCGGDAGGKRGTALQARRDHHESFSSSFAHLRVLETALQVNKLSKCRPEKKRNKFCECLTRNLCLALCSKESSPSVPPLERTAMQNSY